VASTLDFSISSPWACARASFSPAIKSSELKAIWGGAARFFDGIEGGLFFDGREEEEDGMLKLIYT
jgi:hypothetical protein